MNCLLDEVGNNIGCTYDVGCKFSKTVANSSLRECAIAQNLCLMVGAFHGHAHNHACQMSWHPLYIRGMGLTEGEGCEHVFTSSNDLACSTRHASWYHHHQAIEEHFKFWDNDKYALLSEHNIILSKHLSLMITSNLGNFIVNHYREAIEMVSSLEQEFSVIELGLRLSDDDLNRIYEVEKKYLENLKCPLPITRIRMKVEYVRGVNEIVAAM